jgi:succinate dehydrogenase/fumarate reductase-like Fe-S protein
LACRTLTKDLPNEIMLLPLPTFKLIKDLSWVYHFSKYNFKNPLFMVFIKVK